ncbi:Protein of unknown function [Gryllus bimaculatus]|nr:Protein of unknown function [Gryllus bimaculatus]
MKQGGRTRRYPEEDIHEMGQQASQKVEMSAVAGHPCSKVPTACTEKTSSRREVRVAPEPSPASPRRAVRAFRPGDHRPPPPARVRGRAGGGRPQAR